MSSHGRQFIAENEFPTVARILEEKLAQARVQRAQLEKNLVKSP